MRYSLFRKIKPDDKKEWFPSGDDGNSKWWKSIEEKYKKETGKTIDRDDPEYNAQKIYKHWLDSFFAK